MPLASLVFPSAIRPSQNWLSVEQSLEGCISLHDCVERANFHDTPIAAGNLVPLRHRSPRNDVESERHRAGEAGAVMGKRPDEDRRRSYAFKRLDGRRGSSGTSACRSGDFPGTPAGIGPCGGFVGSIDVLKQVGIVFLRLVKERPGNHPDLDLLPGDETHIVENDAAKWPDLSTLRATYKHVNASHVDDRMVSAAEQEVAEKVGRNIDRGVADPERISRLIRFGIRDQLRGAKARDEEDVSTRVLREGQPRRGREASGERRQDPRGPVVGISTAWDTNSDNASRLVGFRVSFRDSEREGSSVRIRKTGYPFADRVLEFLGRLFPALVIEVEVFFRDLADQAFDVARLEPSSLEKEVEQLLRVANRQGSSCYLLLRVRSVPRPGPFEEPSRLTMLTFMRLYGSVLVGGGRAWTSRC